MIFSMIPVPYSARLRIMIEGYLHNFKKENLSPVDKSLLKVSTRNSFRLMEQWRYDFHATGGGFSDDITKEEGEEVYAILDAAFRENFPSHRELDRPSMAVYMERIISGVHVEMVDGRVELPGSRQDLIRFLEAVHQKLKGSGSV